MNAQGVARYHELRADYRRVVGKPFEHFYCPILHRDESADLCRGHVVPEAFEGSDGSWEVQRADIDSFFGAYFEAEFSVLHERGRHSLPDLLTDPSLARKFRPQIERDGLSVGWYRPRGVVPDHHTELLIERNGGGDSVRVAIKMSPSETLAAESRDLSLGFERDLRLPALVSLLKAAHLTLFHVLGYDWALSAGGRFIGFDALGSFFIANNERDKSEILERARIHFEEFVNLVRPMARPPGDLLGTVSDRKLFLCTGDTGHWALVVVVRTGEHYHGVLLPTMNDGEAACRFAHFMRSPAPRLFVRLAQVAEDGWHAATSELILEWPKSNCI